MSQFIYAQETTKLKTDRSISTNQILEENKGFEENNFHIRFQKDSTEIALKAEKIKSVIINEKHDQIISSYQNDFLPKEQLHHFQLEYGIDSINLHNQRGDINSNNQSTLTFSETELPIHLTRSFIEQVKIGKEELLTDREEWVKAHILHNITIPNDEQESFEFLQEENEDIGQDEVIGKSGSRLLVDDEIILQLDSTIWYQIISPTDSIPTKKIYRTFNSNNDQISYQRHEINEEGNWYIDYESVSEYNEDGQLISINYKDTRKGEFSTYSIYEYTWLNELEGILEVYNYDVSTQQLEKDIKWEFKYTDAFSPTDSDILYEYTERYKYNKDFQKYFGSDKYEYTHNENNVQTSYKYYQWNHQITDWLLVNTKDYELDNYDRQISIIESWKRGHYGSLQNYIKKSKEYDDNGNLILDEYYRWNETLQDWVGQYKTVSSYNEHNQIISEISHTWSSKENKFIPNSKNTYGYDKGVQTLVENESYDDVQEQWDKNYKYVYIFNDDGYNTKMEYYTGSSNNEWRLVSIDSSAYDDQGRLISKIDFREGTGYQNKISYEYTDDNMTKETIQKWDLVQEEWINYQQYYYTTVTENNASIWMESDWNNEEKQWEFNNRIDITYNNDGYETSKKTYTGAIDTWVKNGYTSIEYDEFGSIIKKQEFKPFGNDWSTEAYSTDIFQYDYKGKIILEERVIPSNADNSYKFEYKYPISGYYKTLEIHLYGLPGNYTSGVKTEQESYKPFLKPIFINNYIWIENSWKGNYKYEYSYDDLGLKSSSKYLQNFDDENAITGTQDLYKYDSNGKKIYHLNQKYRNKEWFNSSLREYAYNENGNELFNSYLYDWDENKEDYTRGYQTINKYNESNDIIESISQFYTNGEWKNNYKKEYNYIDKNSYDIIKYNSSGYDFNSWYKKGYSEYRYDKENFISTETAYQINYSIESEEVEKVSERKIYFSSSRQNSRLKETYKDYKDISNNSTDIHEIHDWFETFRSSYNLKNRFNGYATQDNSLLIMEDSVNNKLSSRTYYSNHGSYDSPSWVPIEKYEYENANGVQSGITQYIYNGETFDPTIKYSHFYSEETEVHSFYKYVYKNGAFEKNTKYEHQLNQENYFIFRSTYYWNNELEKWVGDVKYENGGTYIWNDTNDEWIGESKIISKEDKTEYTEWDISTKSWVFTYRTKDTDLKNQSIYEIDRWFNNEWIPDSKRITTTTVDYEIQEDFSWIKAENKWHKKSKTTTYQNEEGFTEVEQEIGINGEWNNYKKIIYIKDIYFNEPHIKGLLRKEEVLYWVNQNWQEFQIVESWSSSVEFALSFFKFDPKEKEYVPSYKMDTNYSYTWNEQLNNWLGVRSNKNSNITEKWNNNSLQWELHERKSDFYSPVINFNIPESIPFNEVDPTYTFDIVTTAPGLNITTSVESAEINVLKLKYKESGVMDLVISTPEGVTSDGTPYTARELNISFIIEKALGIDDIVLESQIIAYPNPTSDFVKIMVPSGTVISSVEVITNQGAKIKTVSSSIIDVRGYSKGLYFLRINTNKGNISKSIIVN
ncbi:T9SS type A sorting domain-containing protein [Flammeovirga sp. EKP202]|uniref:T9SS type A sorting domain-containing protein n=1 Tax=Flammeovirga sp. EKP202 TaxID=2770592 RepID=UPI00165F76A9|nr:T9SS type A sorting domain-containing protein [Flammeovirga sp. EKP202]MBD0400303.1 T9SS type A sorting domain-containing protein [Flammeovirga sp. EKP202]